MVGCVIMALRVWKLVPHLAFTGVSVTVAIGFYMVFVCSSVVIL